ncbi:SemiSWEET family sugar transporter [Chryseotalea sanaruensis]|uniref:SemiSWEET family sugar transporter n=1 Tax=Chryseotalea sanaruensis TaxID=2482724 RepID=UPI000F8CCCDA|nr:SemiSWEET family transporter [Chryseotalea sanaruensis]
MNWIELMGHSGSLLSSITFMPQVYKVWQTKRTQDLSLSMMLIVFSSTIVWIIYGVGLMLWPVIICNSIICLLSLMLIYFKLSFEKKNG